MSELALRCASISVGIVDYAHAHYRASEMRLQYAADDARAFSRYAVIAGGGDDGLHRVIPDSEATEDRVAAAFAELATAKDIDVFFLYLSGHGERGDAGCGWFCLVDAQPGIRSLDGRRLDELLQQVPARHVLVIVDCCYAEALASNMTFFAGLEGASGRLFLASARETQRSWEDESLRRSLFSDVLLRALSTDSTIANAGYVHVESALLPHLREQVPLLASARKRGNPQEPVSGGFCAAELRLPTVTSQSLGRRLTTAEAVRANVRRILLTTAAAAVALLLLLDILVFHLAVDATGRIEVRPGLSSTFSLQPFHPVTPVDTGFRLDHVDSHNSDFAKQLATGKLAGVRTHLGGHGLRAWLAMLETGMERRTAASVQALAHGQKSRFDADSDAPPITEAIFLSRLLGVEASAAGDIYRNPRTVNIGCDDDAARKIDFSVISSGPEVFREDALWMAATAPRDSTARAQRLLELAKLHAYRFLHRKDSHEQVDEFAAFASALSTLTSGQEQQGWHHALGNWPNAQGSWCELSVTFALAMSADTQSSQRAELRLWQIFNSFRRDLQGDLPTPEQTLATEALAWLARRRALDQAAISDLAAKIESEAVDLATNVPTHALMAQIAALQPLPQQLVNYLLTKLGKSKGEFDFEPLTAARVLACNLHFLHHPTKEAVRTWLERHAADNRTMSDLHEALGCAAMQWALSSDQMTILTRQLSPTSIFPPRVTNYRGETVITATGDAAAIALGRAGLKHRLDRETVIRLATIAAGRRTLKSRDVILAGLAHQWYGPSYSPASTYARLASANSDAVQRELEVDVATVSLARLAEPLRDKVMAELLSLWAEETEPELRIALARIVGSASLR